MPLVYLPGSAQLFWWAADVDISRDSVRGEFAPEQLGAPLRATLLTPDGFREIEGEAFALSATAILESLARVPAARVGSLPSSVGSWALASKLALELVARERVVPTITRRNGKVEARWGAALAASDDADRVTALAASMSPAAHAVPVDPAQPCEVWAAGAALRAFLDQAVDALLRQAAASPNSAPGTQRRAPAFKSGSWDQRWRAALAGPEPGFEARGFAERTLLDDLERWSQPALGARDRPRICFRLELPESDGAPFKLGFLLQSLEDPSLLVPASDVWAHTGHGLEQLGREFREPEEALLGALARAGRLFAPLAAALTEARPESLFLDSETAWLFLSEGAAVLSEAGFGVIVPGELTSAGQRRLRLRLRVGGGAKSKVAGVVGGLAALGMDELLTVDWEAVIGDQALTPRELALLAEHKAPLVRHRGAWTAIDPRELADIRARIAGGPTRMSTRDALQAVLAGETTQGTLTASVLASGSFERVVERLREGGATPLAAPAALKARLRPYQERGLSWLTSHASLGLGACLADDMGLGKTIQLIAFLLGRVERNASDRRPALLVAPTSVLGNWQRELERFGPSLTVIQHYGATRRRSAAEFAEPPAAVVLTSYGLLRRDAELLATVEWAVVALDEAQNIKNSASATARSARALTASDRFALTGTPVENRLAELWSILEFVNPGLLGPLERFRRDFAVPIERYGNEQAATRLKRVVGPFILRRLKSDPSVISDLPPKNEAKVVCTLTREQATLYKAVVDEEMRRIEHSEGMERRGRVLALLTYTKQICNHPAQYLGESGPLSKRSGKLTRISEMLEEAVAAGDRVLVFTQFREMGERLLTHFEASLDGSCHVQFLHGGTPKKKRDELVQRFQSERPGPGVFVLSLKAGGTGLNLTAASHVFHFDRWWNPAVEDQATDRAYRIGQKRAVQVHKFVCAGTVEEKIDRLLEQKRALAAKVVGAGEHWITELDDRSLRDLFALADSAVITGAEDDDGSDSAPAGKPARSRKRRTELRP